MGTSLKKVSIITPLHNKGAYIKETIESVLKQKYAHWELLIIENHSSDNGPEIARGYSHRDKRIQFIQAPLEVRGPGAARNIGLKKAKGDWVLFLDADDLIDDLHLESLIDLVSGERKIDLAVSGWREVDRSGVEEFKSPSGEGKGIEYLKDCGVCFCPWCIHSCLVSRGLVQQGLEWDESLDRALSEDTAFWFRAVSLSESIVYSNSHTAVYNTDLVNGRNDLDDCQKWHDGIYCVIQNNLNWLKAQGGVVNGRKAENLMRLYSGLYIQAVKAENLSLMSKDLILAKKWLNKSLLLGGWRRPQLVLRKVLGLEKFLKLRKK